MSPQASARVVRIVAVSPGDVATERKLLGNVIDELNRRLAPRYGCDLSLWRWETDAHPGLHLDGPQGLIDGLMHIEDADLVVGVFWNRLGTPTLGAASGTAHELRRAWSAWRENGHPQVMIYFCERKARPRNAAEGAQLLALLRFREALPDEQLSWSYKTLRDFERAVRDHLIGYLLDEQGKPPPTSVDSEAADARRPVADAWLVLQDEDPGSGSAGAEPTVADLDVIRLAIAGLPEAEKLVVSLTFYEGLSAQEIATRIGATPRRVYLLRARALNRLRRSLAD